MSDLEITAAEFFDAIFYELPDDETICVAKDEDGWFNQRSVEDPIYVSYEERWKRTRAAWYFCVSTVDGEMAVNKDGSTSDRLKRTKLNVKNVYCLVLDIDADDYKKETITPPNLAPSWKLESSAGNFQWGYIIDATDRLAEYEALVRWCGEQGWTDKKAGECQRLMRMPHSTNMKEGKDLFKSRITYWEPDVWTLDDLAEDLGCVLSSLPLERIKKSPTKVPKGATDVTDPLVEMLGQHGQLVGEMQGNGFYPVLCPQGDLHGPDDKVGSTIYCPLGNEHGPDPMLRWFKCSHDSCDVSSTEYFEHLVEEFEVPMFYPYDPLPYLQGRHVIVAEGSMIADVTNKQAGGHWLYKKNDWALLWPRSVPAPTAKDPKRSVAASTAFLQHEGTTKTTRIRYSPEYPDALLVPDGISEALNSYTRPPHEKTDKVPKIFLEHIEYLIPAEDERETFLNWLAHKVQNPGLRSFGVIMTTKASQGIGRSLIQEIMDAVLPDAVEGIEIDDLTGEGKAAHYNDWMLAQLVFVNEAQSAAEHVYGDKLYERIKTLVDPRVSKHRINEKNAKRTKESVYFNVMILSNHENAMTLAQEDRRFYVITNPNELHPTKDWFAYAQRAVKEEDAAIYWWLRERDISSFNPYVTPMTPGKEKMLDHSYSPFDEVRAYVEEFAPGDWVTKAQLAGMIDQAARITGNTQLITKAGSESVANRLWKSLPKISEGKNGLRVREKGSQTPVRPVRNSGAIIEKYNLNPDWVCEQAKKGVDLNHSGLAPKRGDAEIHSLPS